MGRWVLLLHACSCLYAAPDKTQTDALTGPPQVTAVFSTNSSSMGHRLSKAVCRVCATQEGDTCTCSGRVYYGKKYTAGRPGGGWTTTFEQMIASPFKEMAIHGQVTCSYSAMGGDPLKWYYKWCYCVEDSVRPWPKFASQSELSQSGWAKYFKTVYGEVPATGYPIDLNSFWMLYSQARSSPWPQSVGECPGSRPVEGTLYLRNNAYSPQDTNWIWHSYPYAELPGNTWQEVIHMADPYNDEQFGAWFLWAPGSGIYFQIGVTRAFQEHSDAYKHWNVQRNQQLARAAAKDNVDSIQFVAHHDCCNWAPCTQRDNLAYMGLEIVGTKLVGTHACAHTGGQIPSIKAGWQASRSCYCNNALKYLNCNDVPFRKNLLSLSSLTNATFFMI